MAQAMIMPKKFFWDNNGKPLAFGKIYTYQAGTTINKETFTTEAGDIANTNPVILNGEGYASIYLNGSYNIVVDDQNDSNIWTEDPVSSNIAEEWIGCQEADYLSSTSYEIIGNHTGDFTPGRSVRIDNGIPTFSYSAILSAVFSAGKTTVIVTDPVVQVGILYVCLSVISENSIPTHGSTKKINDPGGHDAIYRRDHESVSAAIAYSGHKLGNKYTVDDYYGSATPNNSGVLFFRVVAAGTGTADGGKYIDIDINFQLQQNLKTPYNPRAWGAKGDNATDDHPAIQATINEGEATFNPVHTPDGLYRVSEALVIPPIMRFTGAGRWSTSFLAMPSLVGNVIEDDGVSAVKIILKGFEVSGVGAPDCTNLIYMGHGSVPMGTEGLIEEIFLRGGTAPGASNPVGLNYVGNVMFVNKVSGWWCSTTIQEGTNSVYNSYTDCVSLGTSIADYIVNTGAKINHSEIEAPAASSIGVIIQRSAEIKGLTYSPAEGIANQYPVKVLAAATYYDIDGLVINGRTTGSLVGLVDDERAGFSSIMDITPNKYHVVKEQVRITTPDLFINTKKLQCFELLITHGSGFIRHLMGSTNAQGVGSPYVTEINGAAPTVANTPLGPDSTTAFVQGGKISSAQTFLFLLDNVVDNTRTFMMTNIFATNIPNLTANPLASNIDVNGVTANWNGVAFYDDVTGSTFDLTSIQPGDYIRVGVFGIL